MPHETDPQQVRTNLPAMWRDPDPRTVGGLLLSDRIKFYVDQVGLIDPFTDSRLAPASYDLTLGGDWWSSEIAAQTGSARNVLSSGEPLIIEPNSIVFVSSAELLNLPFYIAARFNLKLRLLHEGLLVGTGPQIDPGFSGRLSCPLHNISSEKIALVCGQSFAVIEFEKTTPFAQDESWLSGTTIDEVRRRGEARTLRGLRSNPCVTFPARSLRREPIKGYLPIGKSVSSSVQGIDREVKQLSTDVGATLEKFRSELRTVNILAYLAVVAVAVAMGTYFFAAVNWHKTVYDAAFSAQAQVRTLEADQAKMETRIKDLTNIVQKLSDQIRQMENSMHNQEITQTDRSKANNKQRPH